MPIKRVWLVNVYSDSLVDISLSSFERNESLGRLGKFCETRISPCQTLTCINGQCLLRADGTAVCVCNTQWTGVACDMLISPCISQPCLNNGVCLVVGTTFSCICPQGYFGVRCESTAPTLCSLNCANNGTCAIRGQDNMQICVCPVGYTGARCEIQMSPCVSFPCLNNGLCLPFTNANGTLTYSCVCPAPYTGSFPCHSMPLSTENTIALAICRSNLCHIRSIIVWQLYMHQWWHLPSCWQSYDLSMSAYVYWRAL